METNNIPKGTFQITFTNTIQYLMMGLFYITVTKTNALTQTDIGALSILTFLASTFSLFTLLTLPTALTKFTSEKLGKNQQEEAAGIQKTITKTVLLLSLIGFAIAACLSGLLSQYFWTTSTYALLIILMFTYAFFFNLVTLCNSSLQALYLFGKMATVTIIFMVTSRTIAAILALLHIGLQGVLIGYITGSFVALAVAVGFIHGKLPKTTKNVPLKPILHFSLPLFLSSLTLLVLTWADIVIVAFFLNLSQAGIYYIVINSVGTLSILWIPITTTIFPALSAHHGLQNPQGVTNILKTTSRYLAYITLPTCLGLAAISPTALTFFYGPNYIPGATPLSILSTATIISVFSSLLVTALTAIGKTNQILKINVISAVSKVIMLPTFVPFLQVIGAAVTCLVSAIIGFTLSVCILRKEIAVQLDKEALWKSVLASILIIPFLLVIELNVSPRLPTIQTLTIEILTAASIYAFSLYILKALNTQDFDFLRQAFPKALTKYINILESILVR